MNSRAIDSFAEILGRLPINPAAIQLALRHDRQMRESLKSTDKMKSGHGQGKFLEYYVYELLKSNLSSISEISSLIRKGADVPKGTRNDQERSIRYSENGDIMIYGDGRSLAEIDILALLSTGEVLIVEVINSGNNLAHEHKEFAQKKRLLSSLLNREIVGFLVSRMDLSKNGVVQEFLGDRTNRFVSLGYPPDINLISQFLSKPLAESTGLHKKLLLLTQLDVKNEIDYRGLTTEGCNSLLDGLRKGLPFDHFRDLFSSSLLKNLYVFAVNSRYWSNLFSGYSFMTGKKELDMSDLRSCSDLAIVGLSMRHLRTTIYLKLKGKVAYLKFIPSGATKYKLDGTVPHSRYQRIPAYHAHMLVSGGTELELVKIFFQTFYREEVKHVKRDRIPDNNWVRSLCPIISEYLQ